MSNGRINIYLLGNEMMPERSTAVTLGISVMRLRRCPALQRRLRAINVKGHPYYSLTDVNDVKAELSGYVMRTGMKHKPMTFAERRARGEVILYGLTCYPKLRNIKKSK
jgi:hypothetical protein